MKKKIALLIIAGTILLTFIVMAVVFQKQKDGNNFHQSETPQPTRVMEHRNDEDKNKEERDAFVNLMHNAAPGTNWMKMDADLRYKKMQERAKNYKYRTTGGEWDTLADGNVIGKWDEIGSFNTSGRIWATDIDFETDNIYAFTDGGNLWKGDLDGDNWSVINDNFKLTGTHMLRKIDDRLIAASSAWGTQGVFYTNDEGLSWTSATGMENVTSWGYVFDAEVLNNAEHTIMVLAYEWDYTNWYDIVSIYKSDDLGESFEKIISYDVPTYGGPNKFVLWSAVNGDPICYFIHNDAVNAIDASGVMTTLGLLPITDDGDIMLCGYKGISNTTLYAAHNNYALGKTKFYISSDAGANWTATGEVEEGNFSKNSFNCSQKTEGYLYYGGVDSYRSFTGGDSWVRYNYWWEYYDDVEYNLHADIPYIRTYNNPAGGDEIVLVSTDGGLFKSTNNGLIWNNITNEGMRNAQYYDVYTYRFVPDIIFAGAQDQGYQRSAYDVDNDFYFDQLISGDYGHIVSRSGGDNLWCVYPGFAMYINDAASGSDMFFWDFEGTGHLWMAPVMADPYEDEVAWWGGGSDAGGAYLWRLEKIGPDITGVKQIKNFAVAGGGSISAINYSPVNHEYWYLLTSGGNFYYSENGGDTWTMTSSFSGPGSHYFYGATIEPSKIDADVVYIGGSGYDNPAVYVSSNHGESFTALTDGMPSTLVYDLAISTDDSLLFAATEVAPYVYVKAENKWYDLAGFDAPLQTYWSVDFVDEIQAARFGTYGRGTWEFKLEDETPNIAVNDITENGGLQLYPNPASDVVRLKLNMFLPDATIDIINMQGKVVVSKNAAINKDVAFLININTLPAGNYFLRIKGNGNQFVEKLVITK